MFQLIIILPHIELKQYINRFFYESHRKSIENEEVFDQCQPVRQQTAKVGNIMSRYHTD